MQPVREPKAFGQRSKPHSITITTNGKSRKLDINPYVGSAIIVTIAVFGIIYFGATAYLMLRDDLIGARSANNARLMYEYEDRIAALRSSLDKVTSRQLLDQQTLEKQLERIISRQQKLAERENIFTQIMGKAKAFGVVPELGKTKSKLDPNFTGSITNDKQAAFRLRGASTFEQSDKPFTHTASLMGQKRNAKVTSLKNRSKLISNVERSMSELDHEQKQWLSEFHHLADAKLSKASGLLKAFGIPVGKSLARNVGGPYEPLPEDARFEEHLKAANFALEGLEKIKAMIATIPLANPAPGKVVSSGFGSRIDPFRGHYAMHSGIDFRARRGSPVLATADGKVIYAARKGGYGNLIEVKHADGRSTRYAHLSKILVKVGTKVKRGQKIGKVGSTGRSTGPHLHYEVRIHGKAVNPRKFLKNGKKLDALLG